MRPMISLMRSQVEAYSREAFHCGNCSRDFEASVITWVDASKTPQARLAILKWQFNIVQCTHCGCRHFSGSPFFYEDFEEGLLIAVFPRIPEKRGETEKVIQTKYGYYPVLEFFYDMTQIWMLLYFQEHYKSNANLRGLSTIGTGEERLHRMLRFLKEDPLMISIREKITESFLEDAAGEELMEILGQAVYKLEGMLPWPRDRKCQCGADLTQELTCCGNRINLEDHEHLISKQYVIYCPACKLALSGASCEQCGKVYTWRVGIVATHQHEHDEESTSPASRITKDQRPPSDLLTP
jgi:hypothetical protein